MSGIDNFDDACSVVVSRAEAEAEIHKHAADFETFLAEVGDKPQYRGDEVLGWLGY